MSIFDVHERRFAEYVLGNCALEKLCSGLRWAEGPVYFTDSDFFVCSDVPNNRMIRYIEGFDMQDFRRPSNFSNGNTRDRQGRLLTCEHGTRSVTRTEYDGSRTVLADGYKGKKLNSPNDLVVKSDGSIWFTDPYYGIRSDYEGFKSVQEQDGHFVFRIDAASGTIEVVADDFVQPNGLAFSPDESTLYVADSGASESFDGPRHIRSFTVRDGRILERSRVFAELRDGLFDGLRVDTNGNVWTSAGAGVNCYDPSGRLLGRLNAPEVVANLTFGGARRNRLFITATSSVYAIFVNAKGVSLG